MGKVPPMMDTVPSSLAPPGTLDGSRREQPTDFDYLGRFCFRTKPYHSSRSAGSIPVPFTTML